MRYPARCKEMGRFNILADIKPLSAYGIETVTFDAAEETLRSLCLGLIHGLKYPKRM